RHAQALERDALAHQHARYIMVRHHEELGRVWEGGVFGVPAWLGVAVRADQRQRADGIEKLARQRSRRRIGGKQSVVVQHGYPPGGSRSVSSKSGYHLLRFGNATTQRTRAHVPIPSEHGRR